MPEHMMRATTKRATKAAAYRKAAHHMEQDCAGFSSTYSCLAIDWAVAKSASASYSDEANEYLAVMGTGIVSDRARRELQQAFNECGDLTHDTRILALCFMAAMTERP